VEQKKSGKNSKAPLGAQKINTRKLDPKKKINEKTTPSSKKKRSSR
jgi:hypothetical protein